MAPAEAVAVLPADYTAATETIMLISGGFGTSDFHAALPLWASMGFTVLGAAIGGLLMFLIFYLKNYLSSSRSSEQSPLLKDSESADSTTCSSDGWSSPAGPGDSTAKVEASVSWPVLITTLLTALPSVLGTWCWPLLFVALFPAAGSNIESDSNRETFHHLTFGMDLVLFSTLIWYIAMMTSAATKPSFPLSRWGPVGVVSIGCALIILDPIRHVLLDHGGVFFQVQTLAMYSGPGQLSFAGRFCQLASIIGIVSMVIGVMWHMRVPEALLLKLSGAGDCKTL